MNKHIEEMAKVVNRLAFDLRQNMTSVTRYVRHERAKHPNLTEGQFIDRHLEYRDLALVAVDNILKCLNENDKLREIEKMSVEDNGYRKSADVARETVEAIKAEVRKKEQYVNDLFGYGGYVIATTDLEDIIRRYMFDTYEEAELKKKYESEKDK